MTEEQIRYVLRLEQLICDADLELRLSNGTGLETLVGGRYGDFARSVIEGRHRRIEQIDKDQVIIP